MDYKTKYLKYKAKYLNLKNMIGGNNNSYSQEKYREELLDKLKKDVQKYYDKPYLEKSYLYFVANNKKCIPLENIDFIINYFVQHEQVVNYRILFLCVIFYLNDISKQVINMAGSTIERKMHRLCKKGDDVVAKIDVPENADPDRPDSYTTDISSMSSIITEAVNTYNKEVKEHNLAGGWSLFGNKDKNKDKNKNSTQNNQSTNDKDTNTKPAQDSAEQVKELKKRLDEKIKNNVSILTEPYEIKKC